MSKDTILDKLAGASLARVREEKKQFAEAELIAWCRRLPTPRYSFQDALKKEGLSFICEVKQASPSKGLIASSFPYMEIAKDYEAAGAAAVSVLTEPVYFMGDDRFLKEIAAAAALPVLRKDFTVDSYQIWQAKALGASAVLLICAILEPQELKEYLCVAEEAGLSALVEVHDEAEMGMALDAGARIIGVNNRDLKTFEVDITTSLRLRQMVPKEILFVSESGITTRSHTVQLEEAGVNGVLVGEHLMRAPNRQKALLALMGAV